MKVLADPFRGRTLLGRYRVVMPIGRGGMGTVYLARTEGAAGFTKPVVIKSIHVDLMGEEAMVQMFVREARLLSNLHHAGIVNVLDFGEEEGTYLMVLEYVHGYDLGAWCRFLNETNARLPYEFAVHIGIQVLETLQYTHSYRRSDGTEMTIVHRDISPGNILISRDGEVKLADFGIARAMDEGGEYRSRVGTFKGKLAYSAPELVQGDHPTPQADLYSLGVVLLQIVLGENPFKGEAMGDTVQRVVALPPPRVNEVRHDVPRAFDDALAGALAKEPAVRYASADEFATVLRKLRMQPPDELLKEFVEHIRADFDSVMPAQLGLDRLSERDAAWRLSQEETLPGASPQPSSAPPAGEVSVRTLGTESPTSVLEREERAAAVTLRPRGRFTGVHLLLAMLGVALVATAVVAVVLVLREREPEPAQFVVVQNDERKTRIVSSSSLVSSANAVENDPSTLLTRALHERQGDIQSCFEKHVRQVAGTPEISLRCQLAADGKVLKVGLTPEGLEKTPLGACLLQVARETEFPPPGKPLSLRLPIMARVAE